jgi:hypothetical protein
MPIAKQRFLLLASLGNVGRTDANALMYFYACRTLTNDVRQQPRIHEWQAGFHSKMPIFRHIQ